jgi:hypothetical protein
MVAMQRHDTLAYNENTSTKAPVILRKDDKQSSNTSAQKRQSKHQYLARGDKPKTST